MTGSIVLVAVCVIKRVTIFLVDVKTSGMTAWYIIIRVINQLMELTF